MPNRRTVIKQGLLAATASFTSVGRAYVLPKFESLPPLRLPDDYFRRIAKDCELVQQRLQQQPHATLKELEEAKGWYHFPYTVLPAALLYARRNPANPKFHDPAALQLAFQIGDLLVREDKLGRFAPRLDSYRDTYMWVEAYGLLQAELGTERKQQWAQSIERNIATLYPELVAWKDLPAYTENFIGTSPNHYAWWAATLLVGGVHLGKQQWIKLGSAILRRFATKEQNPDGYWGEHNPDSPTGGYNYLTTLAVGVYWEHTHDPVAMQALRRATEFHTNFTYPDGNLIELFNDRNRYWEVSPWGQFAFSHFPNGRGYSQLLTRNIPDDAIDLDTLGLLGQNALYYHPGPIIAAPPERAAYVHRLHAEAGVRKQGPWVSALCGIVDTPLPRSQWFLDRQANLSLFHAKSGLIITGANSKHQPELATFSEKIDNDWYTTPKGSRLTQSAVGDTLALAYNSFSSEIFFPPTTAKEAEVFVQIAGRGPTPQEAYFSLQLVLRPGTELETGSGQKFQVSGAKLSLTREQIAGSLQHNEWTLRLDSDATLQWPIFPYNPYRNGPETKLEHAVALLQIPLHLKRDPDHWLQPNERAIRLKFQVPSSL